MAQVNEIVNVECGDDSAISVGVKRKRQPNKERNWTLFQSFANAELAEKFVESEYVWGTKDKNDTQKGLKKYFRCNQVKKSGEQCSAELYLLYKSTGLEVDAYKTVNDHFHSDIARKELTSEMKTIIDQLNDLGVKPNRIRMELEQKGWKLKNMTILYNYLSRSKNKEGDGQITVGDLKKWCIDNSIVPVSHDKPYVVNHDIEVSNDLVVHIRVVISTIRLLSRGNITDRLHADGTYKLNWEGFPTIVVGTTDLTKSFVPIAVAIVMNETREDYRYVFESVKNSLSTCNIR